jgi:hypothetical protein
LATAEGLVGNAELPLSAIFPALDTEKVVGKCINKHNRENFSSVLIFPVHQKWKQNQANI